MSLTTAAAAAKIKSITAVAVSVGVTSGVIVHAFRQKKQFYPSVVYICKSNPSMAVIYVQALVMVYLLGKLAGKLFFGTLRAAETERLIEKAWYAITETCLAFTIFKDDLSPKFVALFTLLLFLKCFHWLAEDRVDYMERTPVISYLFHIRIWFLLSLLTIADIYFVHDAYTTTITKGPSVQLVFGFEYALLITLAMNAAVKYILHALDVHSDTFWENKAVLLLYLEFFIGFCKAVMYVIFLAIMVRTYTIPLFAFRPMYHTLRNFKKVFQDLVLSRKAIHNMNTLYPDATAEDFQTTENVCIICREDMTDTAAKKLPCNHIFHTSCLRSWFQRHQTCPTCRLDILRSTPAPSANNPATPPPRPTTTTDPSATAASGSTATANADDHNNAASSSSQSANTVPESSTQNYEHLLRSFLTNSGANNSNGDTGRQLPNEFWTSFTNHTPAVAFNSNNQSSSGAVPPFNPLHMPFIGAAAIQPPPVPDNLSALSDKELRIMEGNTREACLARLKYVTDIKTMLDAAMVMMNHYSSACLIAGVNNVPSTSSNAQNREQQASKQDSPTECSASTSSSDGAKTSSGRAVDSKNDETQEEPPEETEQQRIIRLKRLEKFTNPTS
ncbi:E3 ubiquitin-protein ligase synoviolin B [Adelges cooleyi]|uniref:E3 ubiquitin-protein ligase synoviolin B n=1 Tax=Adelges cooleyi TaxID=133065 RepID=UPI00217F3E84|nr:E3 ubiquitin-protein ligase synoviolin B [Adelges cooleyi]XP_050443056.1 E3 ubiquitin-protein ligase synoviolin B [Adelges cooleyi]